MSDRVSELHDLGWLKSRLLVGIVFASDVLLVSPCSSYLQIMTIMIDDGGRIVVKGYVLELCING